MPKYINRDTLHSFLDKIHDANNENEDEYCMLSEELVRDLIDNPIIDSVEVKHGKWIKYRNCRACSECDFKYYENGGLFNYCPHCGAKMEETK